MKQRSYRVVLFIRSLFRGGAESQFVTLAVELARRGHAVSVITFYRGGPLESELSNAGINVLSINKRSRWDMVTLGVECVRLVRKQDADIVYSFLPEANVIAALLRPLLRVKFLVWGVRASVLELSEHGVFERAVARGGKVLSGIPDRVIANSEVGARAHIGIGYPSNRMRVVANGIDTQKYRPDPTLRARVRQLWNVEPHEVLVGFPARIDPIKDHPTFLRAAAKLASARHDLRFFCIGGGDPSYQLSLSTLAIELGVGNRVTWTGEVEDMNGIYNALDLCVSTSSNEGFPNVLGEAMAVGLPCIATDAGDSGRIIGDCGDIVPVGDVDAIYAMCIKRLEVGPNRSSDARKRIESQFSVDSMVRDTLGVFEELLEASAVSSSGRFDTSLSN